MGKKALYLRYSDFAPIIMESAGIKKGHGEQAQLAEVLGIQPQSITKFINKNQLPTDRVLLFWINNHLPMAKFEQLVTGSKAGERSEIDVDASKKEWLERKSDVDGRPKEAAGAPAVAPGGERPLRRREEDIYYSQVPAIREHGPEWSEGRQIMKLFLLKGIFGSSCNLDNLHFIVQQESNFHPSVPPGTILVVDTNDVKITSALYIFKYGGNSFALRQLDPIDDQTVRVTTGTTPSAESRDMPLEKVKPLIAGRVIWAVYKV